MEESIFEALSNTGSEFFINISTDNVQAASQVLKETCRSVLYLGYETSKPVIETAVENDERVHQEVRDIKPGSLRVRLRYFTDDGFLEVLKEYESGRMKERLQKEFLRVGIKVEGLKIENTVEVNETKEAINKRAFFKGVEYRDEDNVQHDQKHSNTAMMKPIPRDKTAFLNEATSLGLLGPNPRLEKPRAKLLRCMHNSMKINRSFKHVSILLVGITGCGKSATLNHLLGIKLVETNTSATDNHLLGVDPAETNKSATNNHLLGVDPTEANKSATDNHLLRVDPAKTNETKSETRSTKECIVHCSDPEYEVEELSLGLIDTPGFCDTDGPEQDACNFLSIHNFFRTHPTLSGRYANLILLFLKATDNRIEGDNSDLSKSLRCVKQVGLVDHCNPNVIIVLTHVCSIRRKTDEAWTKELKRIESVVSKVVFNALKVFAPVVLIENMYDDCSLERRGDYTVLQNGEMQPKNLYVACAKVLRNNKDNLGLITLNSIFVEGKKGRIQDGHEFKAKEAKKDKFHDKEKELVELFQKAATGGFEDPIQNAMWQYIEEQRLPANEIEEVMKIAQVLENLREGNPPNFESNYIANIEFALGKEISSSGEKMLKEKFKMKSNATCKLFESDFVNVVGRNYNILTGDFTTPVVMKFEVETKYGVAIPKCAKLRKVQQGRSFMEVYNNEKEYVQSRMKSLDVVLNVKPGIFNMKKRAGYNKKSSRFTSLFSTSEYSFLFEQRLFELQLGNYEECLKGGMTFTEDFKSSVARLPSRYDKRDDSCVTKFGRFFDRFGHFVVSSAYVGGSVEVKFSSSTIKSTKMSLAKAKANLYATLDIAEAKSSEDGQKTNDLLKQSTYSWNGGKAAPQKIETISDKKRLQKWKDSLLQNPVMLTTELTLELISTAVRCVDDQKEQATYDALEDLLESDIKNPIKEAIQKEVENATTRSKTVIRDEEDSKCFPSTSLVKVQSENGEVKQKKMTNLDVGDKVMGWDQKRNRTVFTKVIMFAHLAPDAVCVKYLKITLEDGNEITLSGNHLVMAGKHKKAILARKMKPGDILFSVNENQEISPKKILAVEKVVEQGIFCPITLSGNVIVDNVLASCYASVEDYVLFKGLVKISAQNMAHLGLMPMRALHKLRSKWLRKIPNGQTIHPYVQWLCKLNHPCMVHEHA